MCYSQFLDTNPSKHTLKPFLFMVLQVFGEADIPWHLELKVLNKYV